MTTLPLNSKQVLLLGVGLLLACEGSGGPGGSQPRTPAAVVPTTATTQTAVVGTAVPVAPAVRVTDSRGQPMPGISVAFAITAGAGSLGTTSATTGADGQASAAAWTLGTTAGANAATATVVGLQPVQFSATGVAG